MIHLLFSWTYCGIMNSLNSVSIRYMSEKLKSIVQNDRVFYLLVCCLVAVSAFGLGRASVIPPASMPGQTSEQGDLRLVDQPTLTDDRLTIPAAEASPEALVASIHGARYYRQDCSGVGRINQDNLLYFPDERRARAAGYTPASGCFE